MYWGSVIFVLVILKLVFKHHMIKININREGLSDLRRAKKDVEEVGLLEGTIKI